MRARKEAFASMGMAPNQTGFIDGIYGYVYEIFWLKNYCIKEIFCQKTKGKCFPLMKVCRILGMSRPSV